MIKRLIGSALITMTVLQPLLAASEFFSAQSQVSLEQLDQNAKRYRVTADKDFDDVIQDLEFMITQNNFRLTGRNNVGHAIAESLEKDYPESQVIHFCSIQKAKKIIELNPDFIFHMPCKISAHERDGKVIIEAQLIPENNAKMKSLAMEINAMMREIADYAAE